MTAVLLAVDRDDGERLVVSGPELAGGRRGVELSLERRELAGWRLVRRIVLRAEEIEPVRDVLSSALSTFAPEETSK
ncbi:MAG: hypothetical protein ACRENE_25810 [Polyangiaceae bacterium]